MKKRLLSLLLLAALLLTLFPFGAFAEEPEEGDAEPEEPAEESEAEESRENMGNVWGLPAEDVIYFGVYKDKPVPWLVLDADQTNMGTEGVYLFSRDLIDSTQVRFDESSTRWEGSLAQEWCTNFAASAFSEAESALVPYTDKYDPPSYPNQMYGITWAEMELKQEQVFFLSVMEVEQYYGSYAPDNKYTVEKISMESYYWLRTPHYYHADYHSMVLQSNMIHDKLPYEPWAARPCINLSVQDAVYVLPADDAGETGAVPLPSEQEVHEWKLIAPLEEHSFRAETTAVENGVIRVSYSGAETGENIRLTLLIRDEEGNTLGLRRLTRPESAEGTLELKTAELDLPKNAVLFLFCEELNGAYVTNYASPLQELKTDLPAQAAPAVEPAAPAENNGESGGESSALPEGESKTPRPGGKTDAETPEETQNAPAEAPQQEPAARKDPGELMEKIKEYYPVVALGFFLLLAIAMIAVASYRRSLVPVILLILLMLMAAVVYLRLCRGQVPERLFAAIEDLF